MLDLLRARRSVRSYTKEEISPETMALLQEAVLRAPSSRGRNPWEFVFVTDKSLLQELSTVRAHGSHFLRDAALGVAVLGDDNTADTWVEDCSITAIILQLACESLGLGSCWVQIRMREDASGATSESRVRRILNIPDHLRVASIISIGHPAQKGEPHPRQSLQDGKIRFNTHA
jgi:nitroreductase